VHRVHKGRSTESETFVPGTESREARDALAGDRQALGVEHASGTRGEPPIYLSPAAAARLVGIGRSLLYELAHEPGFPAYKLGARTLIHRAQFLAWFERRLRRVGE
jgi:excisionase family DNA binding protein